MSVCDVRCVYIWREIIDKSPDTICVSSNGMIHCQVTHKLTLSVHMEVIYNEPQLQTLQRANMLQTKEDENFISALNILVGRVAQSV